MRLRSALLPVLLGVCSLALSPATAVAAPSEADRTAARALALEGHQALLKKEWAIAADRFARADALVHAPTLLLGVARAQVGLGRWIAAQETYTRILREGAAPGSPAPFFKAIEDARAELGALTPRIPAVVVNVHGPSPNVTLDDTPLPVAALGVKRQVDPGKHVVRAMAEGFAPAEATFESTEGKVETVALELRPAATPPTVATKTPPQARVAANAPQGQDGPSAAGATRWGTQKTLGVVALGVGGAGLALGAVTGILAIVHHDELADVCPNGACPADQELAVGVYRTFGALSTAGFIVGGVAAGAGVALLVTAPKAKPKSEVTFTPLLSPGYAGVLGRF